MALATLRPPNLTAWASVDAGLFRFGALGPEPSAVAPLSFRAFIARVHPRFVWYEYCERLAAVLQRVADDELKRVMVLAPRRHGKSETVTRLFSAYYVYRHPERWVGLAAYGAQLAYGFSRAARQFVRRAGVELSGDAEAVEQWQTTAGGGLWAVGVGGPATGKGFHLGVLDDPVKNAEEARSPVIGERNREWWESTWYTCQEPGAALVVITTRWPGPADIVGWLFEQESADDGYPERWHVVALEAEKTAEPYPVPRSCSLDRRAPLPRALPARETACPRQAHRHVLLQRPLSAAPRAPRRWDVQVGLVAPPRCRARHGADDPLLGHGGHRRPGGRRP